MTESTSRSKLVRALRRGRMTIPADFRRSLGFDKDTVLEVTLAEGALLVRPVQLQEKSQGAITDAKQTNAAPD